MTAQIEGELSNTLTTVMCPAFTCTRDARCLGEGGGGWVFPIMVYTGRLRPKGVPFSGFLGYERVWISLVEVYQRVENNWNLGL